ncbi:MAG: zinc ribbon domain-containing protein [Clostridia bacterium]|nr:zinc ribbon domain-containing protein [Clostridia bacterium]
MICKKCNAQIDDGSIFCCECGGRVDGKKTCQFCNALISENAIYCNKCGKRLDGKKICSKCGAEMKGAFCSICGNQEDKPAEEKQPTKMWDKQTLIAVITSGSVLLGLLLTFIFAHCSSAALRLSPTFTNGYGYESLIKSLEWDIFHLLSVLTQDIKDGLLSAQPLIGVLELLSIIVISLCFVAISVLTFVAIGKFVKNTIRGRSTNLSVFFGVAYGCYVVINVIFYTFIYIEEAEGSRGLSAASIVGFVLPLVLAMAGKVVNGVFVDGDYLSKKKLGKDITTLISIMLSLIAVFLLLGNAYEFITYSNTTGDVSSSSQYTFLRFITWYLYNEADGYVPSMINFVPCLLFFVATITLIMVKIFMLTLSLLSGNKFHKASMIISIVMVACAVLYFVCAICMVTPAIDKLHLLNRYVTKNINLMPRFFAGTVLSAMSLVPAIISVAFARQKQ